MKIKAIIALVIVALLGIGGLIFYNATHVDIKAGYVGYIYDRRIKVGDDSAIAGTSVINKAYTGRVAINPLFQEIYMYPTTIVPKSWTASKDEGSEKDESFKVGTKEGKNVTMDVYISVRPADVGRIIASFGGKDFDNIVKDDLYGLTKGKLSIVTQDVSVYDVQSDRSKIQEECFKALSDSLVKTYGIELVRFEIGNLDLPDDIQGKIDQKTEAINAVELAKLDRQKQDEVNQKIVDQQKAESQKDLISKQVAADAAAYEAQKKAEAQVAVAEAEKKQAQIDLDIAKLNKQAELEKQQAYTANYFKDKQIDAYKSAMEKVNSDLKIIVSDGQSGYGSIYGLNEVIKMMNQGTDK